MICGTSSIESPPKINNKVDKLGRSLAILVGSLNDIKRIFSEVVGMKVILIDMHLYGFSLV